MKTASNTVSAPKTAGAAPAPTAAPAPAKPVTAPVTAPQAVAPVTTPAGTTAAAAGVAAGAAPVAVKRGGGLTRDAFDIRSAVTGDGSPCFREVEGKALLTGIPANYDGKRHKALEMSDFTKDQPGEAAYWTYKANTSDLLAAQFKASADGYRTQAANVLKFGNKVQRDNANKAATMAKEFKALLEQMKAEGADTSSLEAMIKA